MNWEDILADIASGKIKVQSVEECAKAEVHLCSDKPTGLKGEQEATCSECGRPLFFTDTFPKDGPQPRKVCMKCALDIATGAQSFDA